MPSLRRYLLVRILLAFPTLVIVTSIIFLLLHIAPGNPIDIMLATTKGSREIREILIQRFGFDKPLHEQYFLWLYNVFTGNLGFSVSGRPVVELISSRIWYTVELMLLSQLISAILAIVFGAISGYKHGSTLDKTLSLLALVGYSIPDFWLGLIFILVFSVSLRLFPVGAFTMGLETALSTPFDHLKYLVLPTTVLVIGFTPYYFRLLRASMVEVSRKDYILAAKSKGLSERVIVYKHALRNALAPTVTAIGTSLGLIFGGSYVVEVVFAWPGLGSLLVSAAIARDYWVVMGVSFITAVMVVASSIMIDVLYMYLNPQIKFEGGKY